MRILKCIINFIEDLIQEKSGLWLNLGVNWNKLKSKDLNGFLGGLIGGIRDLIRVE